MAYNQNIPAAGNDPTNDQPLLLANFQSISTFLNVNHVDFDEANQGKHIYCQFPEQTVSPPTNANEGAIYTKQSTLTGNTELNYRRESNGTEIEFTGFLGSSSGWTRLPSGILLKWGFANITGSSAVTFPAAATIPAFTAIYGAWAIPNSNPGTGTAGVEVVTFNTTTLTLNCFTFTTAAAATRDVNYLAIGI